MRARTSKYRLPGEGSRSAKYLEEQGSVLVQVVEAMQRANREFRIFGVDQQRELYFGGRDGADVDPALGQRLEGPGGDPGMAAHANADDRDFGDIAGPVDAIVADFPLCLGQHVG